MMNLSKLQRLSLFSGMSEAVIAEILGQVDVKERHIPRGGTILFQGDHYTELHILAEGSAFAEMTDVSGKSVRIQNLTAPEVLAPGVIFSSNDELPGNVYAESECRLLIMDRQDVGVLCGLNTDFRENFLRLISDRFVFISKRMTFLSFKTIRGKIAQYLLTLEGADEGFVVLPSTMEELARYFGAARPSVSRVFIELESKGYIQRDRNRIKIIDVQGLKDILS